MRLILSTAIAFWAINGVAAADNEADHPTGRLVGIVTVAGTGEPVAGAKVSALIGQDGTGVRYAQAEAISDAAGRYVLELPMGHAQFSQVLPPPGYWRSSDVGYEPVVTTPEAPELIKHFQVQRGAVWQVLIEPDEATARLLPDVTVYGQRITAKRHFTSRAAVDSSGRALLTLPEMGGEYEVRYLHKDLKLFSKTPGKLSIEPGFRPDRVARVEQDGAAASVEFVDEAGRKATLSGASGVMVDGQAEIRLHAEAPQAGEAFTVGGWVVDGEGQPVSQALVALGSQDPSGPSMMTGLHARTDETGQFTIVGVPTSAGAEAQVFLMVEREGLAGIDTRPRAVPKNAAEVGLDFETIELGPGHQARLRVLDAEGKPVLGAWVEPGGSYAARSQFTRTDAEGRCTLRDLAAGVHRANVQFGRMYAEANFVVTPARHEEATVRLAPLPDPPPTATKEQKPLAVGDELPEWKVAAWTDGAERKLSEYRGKVVVIDVWGIWCSSCLHGIPGLQEVQERFRERDVLFLGLHTAGTDIGQVQKLMELKEWSWPTAVDAGDDMLSGATVERYRIRHFPTTIVVGRNGRIAFSTDDLNTSDREAGMKEMERIARELEIEWPFPEDLATGEAISRVNRILAHRLSNAIEAALSAQNEGQ